MVAAVAALALLGPVISGGYPAIGSSPAGVTLRYIPDQPFGIMVAVRNRGPHPILVRGVRVLEPPGTLVRQIGTRLQAWRPPRCTGNHSCPAYAPPFGPFTAARPKPLRVLPGKSFGAELDFRLGGCREVPFAAPTSPKKIDVIYDGGHQVLSLGAARPLLRFPKPADCVPRPHSDIAITGPWATGSTWTMPGSTGDTCSDGVFTSRTYLRNGGPMVYVQIFPAARRVDVVVGIGLHGWTTFHSRYAVVTTTHTRAKDYGGRFHATIVGRHDTTFRAYGAWRCTRARR